MDKYKIAKERLETGSFIRRNFKTQPPSYLVYRLSRPFLKIYNKVWRRLNGPVPWTSPASIAIFNEILSEDMTGFEFGSGSSTAFFAKRLKSLISVEHDSDWYQKVKHDLEPLNNVEYKFHPPGEKNDFTGYADEILNYPDNSFDFVLVDGRNRVKCCFNAESKLKPNGILVLDNSERSHYAEVFEHFGQWKCISTTTGLTDTTFWFKPPDTK